MVGAEGNFVDTQKVSLTNTSDSLTYTQVTNVTMNIDRPVTKRQLTDDTIDNLFSGYDNFFEGDMVLTTPEYTALQTLTILTSGTLPTKTWELKYTDDSNSILTITISGQMKSLPIIDVGIGAVTIHFRIEGNHIVGVT